MRALEPLGAGGGMIAVDPFMAVTAQSGNLTVVAVVYLKLREAGYSLSIRSLQCWLAGWLVEADLFTVQPGETRDPAIWTMKTESWFSLVDSCLWDGITFVPGIAIRNQAPTSATGN